MKLLKISLVAIVVLLTSCDGNIEIKVNASDLIQDKSKRISNGDLFLEISSCDDYQDSRKPSSSLIKAKSYVPSIFVGSEFVECFSKKFDSFAHFKIPIMLDRVLDGKNESEEMINIVSNEKTLLGVMLPEKIRLKANQLMEDSYTSLGLNFSIILFNDTKSPLKVSSFGSYIDGEPHLMADLSIKENSDVVLKLSDLSVDQAFKIGSIAVLYYDLL